MLDLFFNTRIGFQGKMRKQRHLEVTRAPWRKMCQYQPLSSSEYWILKSYHQDFGGVWACILGVCTRILGAPTPPTPTPPRSPTTHPTDPGESDGPR